MVTGRLKVFKHTGQGPKHQVTIDPSTNHFLTHSLLGGQDLLYMACPGEFCGILSALTGEPSLITITAASDSHLAAITKSNLYL